MSGRCRGAALTLRPLPLALPCRTCVWTLATLLISSGCAIAYSIDFFSSALRYEGRARERSASDASAEWKPFRARKP